MDVLLDKPDKLLRFEIATLRDTPVKLPADQEVDAPRAAQAARQRGMQRLAARLEGMTDRR